MLSPEASGFPLTSIPLVIWGSDSRFLLFLFCSSFLMCIFRFSLRDKLSKGWLVWLASGRKGTIGALNSVTRIWLLFLLSFVIFNFCTAVVKLPYVVWAISAGWVLSVSSTEWLRILSSFIWVKSYSGNGELGVLGSSIGDGGSLCWSWCEATLKG